MASTEITINSIVPLVIRGESLSIPKCKVFGIEDAFAKSNFPKLDAAMDEKSGRGNMEYTTPMTSCSKRKKVN